MPAWSVDAAIALSGGASSRPRGLAAILSTTSASSRISSLLSRYNVSGELAALGLSSEYDTAISAADVRTIASLLGTAATLAPSVVSGRRLSASAANQTLVGQALGRLVLVVSTATQLEAALRNQDVGMAASALVGALGELESPLGRTLEAVVRAGSIGLEVQSARTVPEIAGVVSSAMDLLPLDERVSSTLAGLIVVSSLASELVAAATANPPDVAKAITVCVSLARELGAPAWVVDGLQKIVPVASIAPRMVSAVAEPNVPAAILALVEMAASVAGTDPWVVAALSSLIGGNFTGALEAVRPQLQPSVLMNAFANVPPQIESALLRATPSFGSSAGGNSAMSGIVFLQSVEPQVKFYVP